MSYAISSSTSPLVVLSSGVARIYGADSFVSEAQAQLKPATRYRLYQTDFTASQKNRLAGVLETLKSETNRLAEAMRIYDLPDRTNLGRFRVASSSDPESFLADAADDAPTGKHYVEVETLAQTQTNNSVRLTGSDPVVLEAGDYQFELDVNGQTSAIEVSVHQTGAGADTNEALLDKIGRQIMAADANLQARVVRNYVADENNLMVEQVSLSVAAVDSGQEVRFSLADTSGDLIERLGLSRTTLTTAPARVYVDQRLFESFTNQLTLVDPPIGLSLLKMTGSSEILTIKAGREALVGQTRDLVGQYNSYVDYLKTNRSDLKPVILNDLMTEMDGNLRTMKDIGIVPTGGGELQLTPSFGQTLEAEPEKVREALLGEDGFFTGVKKMLKEILTRDITQYGRVIKVLPRTYRSTATFIQSLGKGLNLSVVA